MNANPKIAVWFHCRLSGGMNYMDYHDKTTLAVNQDYARNQFVEQIKLLVDSGLYANSNYIFIGLNGGAEDAEFVAANAPKGCTILAHGDAAESLTPTMLHLENWIKDRSGWKICFWHMKGVTHPNDQLNLAWRGCMERCVIRDWQNCVADLEEGYDMAGAHWLAPEQYGPVVGNPIWGGAFWWGTSDFLRRLPELKPTVDCTNDWYNPEHWPGNGPRPRVRDYAPHWPGLHQCTNSNL